MCLSVLSVSVFWPYNYYHYQDPGKNLGTSCLIILFIFANIWADIHFLPPKALLSNIFIFPKKALNSTIFISEMA